MKPASRYDFKMTSSTTHPVPGENVYMQGPHPGGGGAEANGWRTAPPPGPGTVYSLYSTRRARCPERPRPTQNAAQTDHSSPGLCPQRGPR